mmetsp:Transcript_3684/g.11622  ORF Transcript_3684/g.11622 Transcript_3684/m.11622 type:complete len:380 (-) Transcript_3684:19-1158(-)
MTATLARFIGASCLLLLAVAGVRSAAASGTATTGVAAAWTFQAPFEEYTNNAPVAYHEGLVFAGFCTNQSGLVALNASTGAKVWSVSQNVSGEGACAYGTAASGGRVFVSGSFAMNAFNASTGAHLWSTEAPQYADGEGIITANDGATIVVLFPEEAVIAFSAKTGGIEWAYEPSSILPRQTPVYDETTRRVFLANRNGSITAIDASSGAWLWAAPAGSGLVAEMRGLAAACGVVVTPDFAEDQLIGISAANGTALWTSSFPSPFAQPLASPSCALFAVSILPSVGAFDVRSGLPTWRVANNFTGSYARPAVAGGVLWTVGSDLVTAFNTSTGAVLGAAAATYSENSAPKYATTDERGTMVYFRSFGTLYAFARRAGSA